MEQIAHFATLARRIAELLPEPPSPDDPFGYLAWEELVLTAAGRLGAQARLHLGALSHHSAGTPDSHRVTSQDLIRVASLVEFGATPAAAQQLLDDIVHRITASVPLGVAVRADHDYMRSADGLALRAHCHPRVTASDTATRRHRRRDLRSDPAVGSWS
ncbi:hypothetical protein [Rhodococcus opacus]|uniref:hypothetical protein n=1 Tax=Rhodococcus opacus TaxID=37919 RepID=UPI001C46FC69|nr:hypothetical protein [Rhodococcus opacus]MBV6757447.1 hypothetical protein [Rhodococcus opacus]